MIKKIIKTIRFIIKCLLRISLYTFRIFPIKNNKIIFTNYYGLSGFSDNLKYIALELIKQNKNLKIYWNVKNTNLTFPKEIKVLKENSLKSFYHLATAKVWIDSQRKHFHISKRKNQFYIQTWHGCLGFKKIELDAVNTYKYPKEYLIERKNDTKMINLFISGADWFTNIIRNAFNYHGEVFDKGLPRNDVFFKDNSELIKKIKNEFNLPNDKEIILYAPTFRNDETDLSAYNLDYSLFLEEIEKKLNKEFILIIRLHPRLKQYANLLKYNDKILNGSLFPDMQELLIISDYFITDYSSAIFDFTLQKRPAFVYASDIDEYQKKDRDLYLDIYQLPFSVSKNTNDLINNFVLYDNEKYKNDLNQFFSTVGLKETGKASELLAERIMKICYN